MRYRFRRWHLWLLLLLLPAGLVGTALIFSKSQNDARFSRDVSDRIWRGEILNGDTLRTGVESFLGPPISEQDFNETALAKHYDKFQRNAQVAGKTFYEGRHPTKICVWSGTYRENWSARHHLELMVAFEANGKTAGWSSTSWYDPPGPLENAVDRVRSLLR
jgi:hypothetical protein